MLQGEWEEAGERLYGAKLIKFFPIRQAVPVGFARARFCSGACWARIFIIIYTYISRYSTFIPIKPFYKGLGMQEWMDASGRVWITL